MVRLFAAGLIFACLLIPVGTAARTGLVCIAVLVVLLLRSVRYKFVYAGLGALVLVAAIPFLPQTYRERMGTITEYQGDESASTRVQVWMWTLDYVPRQPVGLAGSTSISATASPTRPASSPARSNNRTVEYHDGDRQGARVPLVVLRDARRAGLGGPRAVAVAAGAGGVADGADPLALRPQDGRRRRAGQGELAMGARDGAAAGAADLPRRRGVRRDRLPAVHLHADRAAVLAVELRQADRERAEQGAVPAAGVEAGVAVAG
jgi:hypothetical protein